MNHKYYLLTIFFLGVITVAGLAAATNSIGGETAYLPLNEGVRNLSFLSSSEVEILETVNKTRRADAAVGSLQPLKISMGLSSASKERAEELGRSNNPNAAKQEERERLFKRVRKFGATEGSVAEVASQGYSGRAVVTELMKNGSPTGRQPRPYFMDAKYTVMGVGCTSAGDPAPICVITLASEFKEKQR